MKPRGTRELNSKSRTMGVRETMHWIPVEELDRQKAFPSFMKAYLRSEHSGVEHIITDERKEIGRTNVIPTSRTMTPVFILYKQEVSP